MATKIDITTQIVSKNYRSRSLKGLSLKLPAIPYPRNSWFNRVL